MQEFPLPAPTLRVLSRSCFRGNEMYAAGRNVTANCSGRSEPGTLLEGGVYPDQFGLHLVDCSDIQGRGAIDMNGSARAKLSQNSPR